MNSARLLTQALEKSSVHVVGTHWRPDLATSWRPPQNTVLLYPSKRSERLFEEEVPLPENLLMLDGTWHQAKSLYRDNAWLNDLPHIRIDPAQASRYGNLRKEPKKHCLSTLEAVCELLKVFEPQLDLSELLASFEFLVRVEQTQKRKVSPRTKRVRSTNRVFEALQEKGLSRYVVICSERLSRSSGGPSELLYLSAVRLGNGARFSSYIQTETAPKAHHIRQMNLSAKVRESKQTKAEFITSWNHFIKSTDTIVGWFQKDLDLLKACSSKTMQTLNLKSVYCNHRRHTAGSLDDVLCREQWSLPPSSGGAPRADQRVRKIEEVAIRLRFTSQSEPIKKARVESTRA